MAEKQSISNQDKDILWINLAAPSLGDSLMDLAARVMLSGRQITLLTHPKNEALYKQDLYFHAVYSDSDLLIRELGHQSFDLVICDSFSPRVLIHKLRLAPFVPFVGLYGYLNGFEVHRTYFAFARMMELLALERTSEPMRPTISLSSEIRDQPEKIDVCVAIGGEWPFRTYDQWYEVVSWLAEKGFSVLLVGSENGVRDASRITDNQPLVRSTVGCVSLKEVCVEVAKAKIFIGADGGLWHIACAIPIPTVVLFADCQIFDEDGNRVTRDTKDMVCETLYDDFKVANIPNIRVIEAFERLWNRVGLTP